MPRQKIKKKKNSHHIETDVDIVENKTNLFWPNISMKEKVADTKKSESGAKMVCLLMVHICG
jgi:hypothetical protein